MGDSGVDVKFAHKEQNLRSESGGYCFHPIHFFFNSAVGIIRAGSSRPQDFWELVPYFISPP